MAKLRAEYYNEKNSSSFNPSANDEENLPSNLTIPGSSNTSSRHQSTISPPSSALYSSMTIAVPKNISTTVQPKDGELSPIAPDLTNDDSICKSMINFQFNFL